MLLINLTYFYTFVHRNPLFLGKDGLIEYMFSFDGGCCFELTYTTFPSSRDWHFNQPIIFYLELEISLVKNFALFWFLMNRSLASASALVEKDSV